MDSARTLYRYMELIDGSTIIKYRELSIDQSDTLLKEKKAVVQNNQLEYGLVFYKLDDGSSIVANQQYSTLYLSVADAEKAIENNKEIAKLEAGPINRNHVLRNKNPFGKDFPIHTKELIATLTQDLGISDYKVNSELLQQVDEKIQNSDEPVKVYMQHFTNILALIGEVLKQENGANWEMKYDAKQDIWESFVSYKGKSTQYFVYLSEDIYERQDPDMPIANEIYLTTKDILKIDGKTIFDLFN